MLTGKNPRPRINFIKYNFHYEVEEYIVLPKIAKKSSPLFFDVIRNRKSSKIFSCLTLQQVSELLWHSAKVKHIIAYEMDNVLSHRASPSAGGIHPIDIFISLPGALETRYLFLYEPFTHRLAKIKGVKSEVDLFLNNINNCITIGSAVLIWFVANENRTRAKYSNANSLIWRDAGALIMTFQLVAAALEINSCPIGTLGEPFLSKAFGTRIVSAGGLLLG